LVHAASTPLRSVPRRSRKNAGSPASVERVRRWLAATVAGRDEAVPDDAESLELLRRARLAPLAAFASGAPKVLAEERRDAFASAVWLERASVRAVALLEDAGIPCVTLKGPAFAVQVLGDSARRSSCDIDLLVRRSQLAAVRSAFAGAGVSGSVHYPAWYEERWHDHAAFRGLPGAPEVTVEVHWDIVRPGLSRLPVDELLQGRVHVRCIAVELPAPDLPWQMVLTSGHAVQHFFDARSLVDVALCAARLDDKGWRTAVEAARRSRLGPALYHAVLLSAAWLDWSPPVLVAGLRPARLQGRLAEAYMATLDLVPDLSWVPLQLAKVGMPLCASSRLCGLAGIAYSLTDRPNVCAALDSRLRSLGRAHT
jgi:Uncharacterised nucleotidyltransferase